jgi:hypothetical protein
MFNIFTKLKADWDLLSMAVMPADYHPDICGDGFIDINTQAKSIDISAPWDEAVGYQVCERKFTKVFWGISKCESSTSLLVTKDVNKARDLMCAWSESKSKEADLKKINTPLLGGGAYVGNLKKKDYTHSF